MTPNPDFRQADDVIVPDNLDEMTGWNPGPLSVQEGLDKERRDFATLQEDLPFAFRERANKPILPLMMEKWNEFQKSKGRGEGSCDWTLLDEFAVKTKLIWKPQIIGSCVASNTFRGWVIRAMFQVVMYSGEYIGRSEYGSDNFSFYVPWSYGMMRKRGGLRSGDGGFCAPMAETLLKDGVVPCNDPSLVDFLKGKRQDDPTDYPEPQSKSFYREFGAHRYLDDFKDKAKYPLLESPAVDSVDQLWDLLTQCKPCFQCSGIAIKKTGTHPDGFAIHKRNPASSWAHNMCFHGTWVASDGERFFRLSNESWGEDVIYNVPWDEVASWFSRRRVQIHAIGEIQGLDSVPPPDPFSEN